MTVLLLLKTFLRIFIEFPVGFKKAFYVFLSLGSLVLLVAFNQLKIQEYLFLNQVFLVFETILIFLIMIAIWFKEELFNIEDIEKIFFLLPVFLCDYQQASIFVGICILYSILHQFKYKNLGLVSIQVMIILGLFFLFLMKIPLQALLNTTSIFLFAILILSIVKKSFHYLSVAAFVLIFYSFHYLDENFRYIVGSILFCSLIAGNVLKTELSAKLHQFRKNKIVDYLYLRVKTFFKLKEENVQIVKENVLEDIPPRIIMEEKIYYTNTIRSSHAISLSIVFIILALSLYFIREII